MTETAGFDPQHDARFQRGYDPNAATGAVPGIAAGKASGIGTSLGTPSDASRGTGADAGELRSDGVVRGTEDPPDGVAASVPEMSREGANDFVRGASTGNDPFHSARAPRGNPFVIALWALGPLLLAGGGTLIVQAAQIGDYSYVSNEVPFAMLLQQISWALAPAMMSAGLITIVGLFFWHAFAWHSARTGTAPYPESTTGP